MFYNISDSNLFLIFITGQVKGIKEQNGYRQSGPIGNFVSTNCKWWGVEGIKSNRNDIDCLKQKATVSQQSNIQLATKVARLTKR